MRQQPDKQTPYDQFNIEIPRKFPKEGISAAAANAIVNSETWTDANPMLNLSSFVTTYCEPEAKDIYDRHMYRNFADPDMYPHTQETEFKCIRWLHDLWNGPKDAEPYGAATIGSSEACMLGGLAHKWNWREARHKAGKDASRPNMVTGGNVQVVWKKFLRYFDVEPRIVPLKIGNYRLTAEYLDKYVDENTICVVAIAGQTFTGEDDEIQEIHDWLDDYEKKTGVSIPMHIDGASGGFVNPFLYPTTNGTSGSLGSNQLTRRATNTAWSRPASAGSCSKTVKCLTKSLYSMSITWVAKLRRRR
jgi:glutamate decarboxylase